MKHGKIAVYNIAKYLGLFNLARWVTARKLRILCYHGISIDDEYLFRPKLYMTLATFEKRMAKLKKSGIPVVPLSEAVEKLNIGRLPDNATVITFDDGWSGVAKFASPVLDKYHFPWTWYLASYYMENHIQVVNLALAYIFWKSKAGRVDFSRLEGEFSEIGIVDLDKDGDEILTRITHYIESLPRIEERRHMLRQVGELMNVDVLAMEEKGLFYLIDPPQAHRMATQGVDLQLHTHRHVMASTSRQCLEKELQDNRAVIKEISSRRLEHFCYPSGHYTDEHLRWLADMGIRSATTCNPGFNDESSNALELNRFLDGENISDIEFEAEIYGFAELMRQGKRRLTG